MIDTHCHIDLYKNPIATALDIEKSGITTIAVTNLPSHFEMAYSHLKNLKKIRVALGFHPSFAAKNQNELSTFKRLVSTTSYIGEIGLDFSKEGQATKDIQLQCFKKILGYINDRPRFITIHSRGAEDVVLKLLDEFKIENPVLHWYSGTLPILKSAIDQGSYFSINPAMAISKKGRAIIDKIPKERILTESDGPYVQIKGNPIKSSDVCSVIKYLKDLWEINGEEVEKQVSNNFMNIISLIKNDSQKL